MSKFWDSEQLIGTVPKNDRGDEIQVRKVTKGSREMVDVRTYYRDDAGDLKPGKGIAIPDDLADEIADLIIQSGGTGVRD